MFNSDVHASDDAAGKLVTGLASILGDEPLPEDAAALEMLAAVLLVPVQQPDLPQEVGSALVAEIARMDDGGAAGLLAALAVVASPPIATEATAAVQRLRCMGTVSRASARVGTLKLRDATLIDGGDAELIVAMLQRPGVRRVQVAVIGIEHEDSGGALVECMLTPPMRKAQAQDLLVGGCEDDPRQPIDAAELTQRVRLAAQRTIDLGGAVGCDAAAALPLISRALTGDPDGIPRPEILAPWEEDDEELIVDAADDEDGSQAVKEALLDEFEEFARSAYEPGSCVWQHGDFIASCMLDWKSDYDDGCLGRWTADDVAEFLLDYFPRKVTVEPETLDVVPDCALAFLYFLDDRHSLSGAPIEHLGAACEAVRDEFRERAGDPAHWGMAKTMAMQMLAEGVDPSQPGAMGAWIEEFNARPRTERDAVIGVAADRMLAAASPPPKRRHAPERRRKRKAQRSARKRSRR